MKSKILCLLAVSLLAGPMAANASLVTWNFSGTWDATLSDGSVATGGTAQAPLVSIPAAGSSFGLSISFDTANIALGSCAGALEPSSSCTGYDTIGLKFVLTSPSCSGGVCTSGADPNGSNSRIIAGNDTASIPGPGATNDGLVFRLIDVNGIRWAASFGTDDLSVFNSSALPSSFDSRLLQQANFIMCNPNPATSTACGTIGPNANGTRYSAYRLFGTISSTSVPEPGTLALLGIGLAGLGASRRRKAA